MPGYRAIGAVRHAAVAERAMTLVREAEQHRRPQDTEKWFSSTLMELVGDRGWDELDLAWIEADRAEDYYALMSQFIREAGLL
jgi:hypothetical protein